MNIEIDFEEFAELLYNRLDEWERDGEKVPCCVLDYIVEMLRDCGGTGNPQTNSPSYIIDNLVVNGWWQSFEEARQNGETDEELVERLKDDVFAVFEEEKIILHSCGF